MCVLLGYSTTLILSTDHKLSNILVVRLQFNYSIWLNYITYLTIFYLIIFYLIILPDHILTWLIFYLTYILPDLYSTWLYSTWPFYLIILPDHSTCNLLIISQFHYSTRFRIDLPPISTCSIYLIFNPSDSTHTHTVTHHKPYRNRITKQICVYLFETWTYTARSTKRPKIQINV